jgi:hypothetical protein
VTSLTLTLQETIMDEPHAAHCAARPMFARVLAALETLCAAIAGFALLAGARAFTFTALLAWREPVLGGAGLVLLGLIGWLRWCWCRRWHDGRARNPAFSLPFLHRRRDAVFFDHHALRDE